MLRVLGHWSRCQWQVQIRDRLVLSIVVLIYLAYPTLVKQSMSALACERLVTLCGWLPICKSPVLRARI